MEGCVRKKGQHSLKLRRMRDDLIETYKSLREVDKVNAR